MQKTPRGVRMKMGKLKTPGDTHVHTARVSGGRLLTNRTDCYPAANRRLADFALPSKAITHPWFMTSNGRPSIPRLPSKWIVAVSIVLW